MVPQQVDIIVYESDAMRTMSHNGQHSRKKKRKGRKEEKIGTQFCLFWRLRVSQLTACVRQPAQTVYETLHAHASGVLMIVVVLVIVVVVTLMMIVLY